MQERGPRQPLSGTKRFILNALSSGLGLNELKGKIESDKKSENSTFSDIYGDLSLKKDVDELIGQGFIKVLFETTPSGDKALDEDLKRRALVKPQISRLAPIPIVRPPRIIPQSSIRDFPKPPSSIPPRVEVQLKKKDQPIKDLRELGKLRDQFKKD